MTRHRLIRATIPHLISCTEELHPRARQQPGDPAVPSWFAFRHRPADATLSWTAELRFGHRRCRLELEQGACGVLAHLTVSTAIGPGSQRRGLPTPMTDAWAARQLRSLALRAETRSASPAET